MNKKNHYGYFKGVGGITLNAWIHGQENVSCVSTRPSDATCHVYFSRMKHADEVRATKLYLYILTPTD